MRNAETKKGVRKNRKLTPTHLGGKLAAVSFGARFAHAVSILLLSLAAGTSLAAEQSYDYDALGRLVRSVGDGQANEYLYDPAGNLLQVTNGTALPPTISSDDLGDFRRNEFRHVAVSGGNLVGATIRSPHQGIVLSNVVTSATAINFRVAISATTPLGVHQLFIETAAGSASAAMNVVPGMAVSFEPMPVAVPPDNQARRFTVRLSEPATQALSFSLSTSSPSIAKTTASQVSFAVGQIVADIGVIGVTAGNAVLSLSHPSLVEAGEAVVTVRTGAGSQFYYSVPVGITRGVPWTVAPNTHTFSPAVGITRGVPWPDVANRYTVSKSVGIIRGGTWLNSSEKLTLSKPVGIVRGVPFARSSDTLVVTPPVGISKP
jgi:hypothetical protein